MGFAMVKIPRLLDGIPSGAIGYKTAGIKTTLPKTAGIKTTLPKTAGIKTTLPKTAGMHFMGNRVPSMLFMGAADSSRWQEQHTKGSQAIMDMLGPYMLTNDLEWDQSNGELESYTRLAIQALHPGATTDIQKVIMARRIGIGRDEQERAGQTGH